MFVVASKSEGVSLILINYNVMLLTIYCYFLQPKLRCRTIILIPTKVPKFAVQHFNDVDRSKKPIITKKIFFHDVKMFIHNQNKLK